MLILGARQHKPVVVFAKPELTRYCSVNLISKEIKHGQNSWHQRRRFDFTGNRRCAGFLKAEYAYAKWRVYIKRIVTGQHS